MIVRISELPDDKNVKIDKAALLALVEGLVEALVEPPHPHRRMLEYVQARFDDVGFSYQVGPTPDTVAAVCEMADKLMSIEVDHIVAETRLDEEGKLLKIPS